MSIDATGSRPAAQNELAAAREFIAQLAAQRAEHEARQQDADQSIQQVERRQQGAAAILLDLWA